MNEVKIKIPGNCELIKDGDTYIVKEKKQNPPRSWEEFCERYSIKVKEQYICAGITTYTTNEERQRQIIQDRNLCTSKEEAEAFRALMQLRQLRKAWVGDWDYAKSNTSYGILFRKDSFLVTAFSNQIHRNMLFQPEKWPRISLVALRTCGKLQKFCCNEI